MTERVPRILESLTFQRDSFQTLYLNHPRVEGYYFGNMGAIDGFVRSETNKGSVGGGVGLKGEVGRETVSQVSWNLESPAAKVLALRGWLNSDHQIDEPDAARKGRFVVAAGRGFITGGDFDVDYMRGLLDPIEVGLYNDIESRRASQEQRLRRTEANPDFLNLSTLVLVRDSQPRVIASFLDHRWIGGVSEHFDVWTELFGVVRDSIGTAILVSSIHAYVRYSDADDA